MTHQQSDEKSYIAETWNYRSSPVCMHFARKNLKSITDLALLPSGVVAAQETCHAKVYSFANGQIEVQMLDELALAYQHQKLLMDSIADMHGFEAIVGRPAWILKSYEDSEPGVVPSDIHAAIAIAFICGALDGPEAFLSLSEKTSTALKKVASTKKQIAKLHQLTENVSWTRVANGIYGDLYGIECKGEWFTITLLGDFVENHYKALRKTVGAVKASRIEILLVPLENEQKLSRFLFSRELAHHDNSAELERSKAIVGSRDGLEVTIAGVEWRFRYDEETVQVARDLEGWFCVDNVQNEHFEDRYWFFPHSRVNGLVAQYDRIVELNNRRAPEHAIFQAEPPSSKAHTSTVRVWGDAIGSRSGLGVPLRLGSKAKLNEKWVGILRASRVDKDTENERGVTTSGLPPDPTLPFEFDVLVRELDETVEQLAQGSICPAPEVVNISAQVHIIFEVTRSLAKCHGEWSEKFTIGIGSKGFTERQLAKLGNVDNRGRDMIAVDPATSSIWFWQFNGHKGADQSRNNSGSYIVTRLPLVPLQPLVEALEALERGETPITEPRLLEKLLDGI